MGTRTRPTGRLKLPGGRRTLFVKWVLLNAAAIVFFVLGGLTYMSHITGAARVAIPVILVLFAIGTVYGGRLCWRAHDCFWEDGTLKSRVAANKILHDAKWLDWYAYRSQVAGLCATILGFYVIIEHQQSGASSQRLAGGAVALLGSFVGVLCSMVLLQTHRWLEHDLGHDE